MIVDFQDHDHWFMAVGWIVTVSEAGTNRLLRREVHILHTQVSTGKVLYEVRAADWASSFWPTKARTTLAEAYRYFTRRLTQWGGNSAAYELLDVDKPAVSMDVAPESREAHDELYARAAKLLDIPEDDLRKKYGHLNPGLQAMNLRNRLRAKGHNV